MEGSSTRALLPFLAFYPSTADRYLFAQRCSRFPVRYLPALLLLFSPPDTNPTPFCSVYIYDTAVPPRVGSKTVTDTSAPRSRTPYSMDWEHRSSLKVRKIVQADPNNCRWTLTDAGTFSLFPFLPLSPIYSVAHSRLSFRRAFRRQRVARLLVHLSPRSSRQDWSWRRRKLGRRRRRRAGNARPRCRKWSLRRVWCASSSLLLFFSV
jgi:hypothetical protein